MANKVIIGILVLLLVINAAIGTYAYLLSRDIDTLSMQLADQQEELNSYRWIDQEKGVVGIPIARAMDLVLQESAAESPR